MSFLMAFSGTRITAEASHDRRMNPHVDTAGHHQRDQPWVTFARKMDQANKRDWQ